MTIKSLIFQAGFRLQKALKKNSYPDFKLFAEKRLNILPNIQQILDKGNIFVIRNFEKLPPPSVVSILSLDIKSINPFVPNSHFFYPLKTSENLTVRERVYWENGLNPEKFSHISVTIVLLQERLMTIQFFIRTSKILMRLNILIFRRFLASELFLFCSYFP